MSPHPHHSRHRVLLTCCALMLLWTGTAAAQSSNNTGAETKSEALRYHAAGVDAFSSGRYKSAIEQFRKADRLLPSAAIAFNIARAYEKLGDSSNALESYRDYLRRNEQAPDRLRVERHIEELEEQLAARGLQQLSVLSEPRGALITIDGLTVGETPWTGELPPGAHALVLELPGFQDQQHPFELEANEALEIELYLQPEAAARAVAQAPAAAKAAVAKPAQRPATKQPTVRPDVAPLSETTFTSARSSPKRRGSATTGESSASVTGPLGVVALGTAAAALGAAGVFELLRRDAQDDARVAATQIEFEQQRERVEDRQTLARILAGVSGGLAITGVALLVASAGEERAPARKNDQTGGLQAALAVTPNAAKVRLWTRF